MQLLLPNYDFNQQTLLLVQEPIGKTLLIYWHVGQCRYIALPNKCEGIKLGGINTMLMQCRLINTYIDRLIDRYIHRYLDRCGDRYTYVLTLIDRYMDG